MAALVYSKAECVFFHKGDRVTLHFDEPWDAKDPVVKARPDLFADEPTYVAATVEQATAAPGETRATPSKRTRASTK